MAKASKKKAIKDQPAKNVKTMVKVPAGSKMKKAKKGGQRGC